MSLSICSRRTLKIVTNGCKNRIREISKISQIIYNQDQKQGVYDKVLNQLLSKHPQATSNALKSFTNHQVHTSNSKPSTSPTRPNHSFEQTFKPYQPASHCSNKAVFLPAPCARLSTAPFSFHEKRHSVSTFPLLSRFWPRNRLLF